MKRLSFLFFLFLFSTITTSVVAQKNYTVEGTTYALKTEVDGALTLLWNTIDGEYRYFAKKGNEITELKNTNIDGDYQEEYKETLRALTSDENLTVDDVNLTTSGLRDFFNNYNLLKDPNYQANDNSVKLSVGIGPFAGLSNEIYTPNPTNQTLLTAGFDVELTDEEKLRRHAIVFRFEQTFSSDEYDYSASDFSLNYRFKFIKSDDLDLFVNAKVVSYTYSKVTVVTGFGQGPADEPVAITEERKGGDFNTPASFGVGADIALGNGHLFVTYNDIVAIGLDNNGEFPIDFSVGYKFSL